MSTDKLTLQAVSTAMHLAPRRESGHLDPVGVEHIQRAEERLLTLPPRQLLAAFLEWNAAGRPVFDALPQTKRIIPGTRPEDERPRSGRYMRSAFR